MIVMYIGQTSQGRAEKFQVRGGRAQEGQGRKDGTVRNRTIGT